MTNLERVAYIRGLAEGLELDTDKKEVKVLDAMLTLLEDMALSILIWKRHTKIWLTNWML